MFKKIVLGGLLVCCLSCVITAAAGLIIFSSIFSTRNEKIETSAGQIVYAYDLPEEFSKQFGGFYQEYALVSAVSESGNGHIYLAQVPLHTFIELTTVKVKAEQVNNPGWKNQAEMVQVGELPVTIRNQNVNVQIMQGQNGDGQTYRSMTAFFMGVGGPALVNVSAPLNEWNEEEYLVFFESFK